MQNEIKSAGSLEAWVGLRYQVVREMIPGPTVSDEAARLFVSKLASIADAIGPESFVDLMEGVIDTCERRPTVALLKRMAGLQRPESSPAVEAWRLVTHVVQYHLHGVSAGTVEMRDRIKMVDGRANVEVAPVIPPDVKQAVAMMGGWGALLESYPAYWNMRWMTFKEMFVPSGNGIVAKK